MLHLDLQTSIPSVAAAMGVLQSYSDSIGVPVDYDRMLEYYSYFTITSSNKMDRIARYTGMSHDFKESDFMSFIRRSGVKEGLLFTESGAYSASGPSITSAIETGLYSKELETIMNLYKEASGEKRSVSMFQKMIAGAKPHRKLLTTENRRLCFLNPKWSALNTGRLQMSNPALFNVSRVLKDIEAAPQGWQMFEVDSGQIEPRIIYSKYIEDPQIKRLIELYNDAYYGLLHYVTMPVEDIRSGKMDFVAAEITTELKEKRNHLKTLGNAVNYGSNSNDFKDAMKDAYVARVGNHPARLAWVADVRKAVASGKKIFHTPFGTPIDITAGPGSEKYVAGSDAHTAHLERCGINNPIQATAADLMRYSILQANKIIQTRAPNSFITKYTHDSGKFCVHEAEYNKVIDDLSEITQYQVADWIPIYGDLVIGQNMNTDLLRRLV